MDRYSDREKFPLTKQGFKNLKKRLNNLVEVKTENIKEQLSRAYEAGDERENDGFYLAFEDFKVNKERIFWIKYVLKNSLLIDPQQNEKIELGHKITLEDQSGKHLTYQLVGDIEVNLMENKISLKSSLGAKLLGKKAGEIIKTDAVKPQEYLIKKIFT